MNFVADLPQLFDQGERITDSAARIGDQGDHNQVEKCPRSSSELIRGAQQPSGPFERFFLA
ncbi:MAG: hypothetical protein JZU65_08380 [Chlorobium sp.]|nr:hypothetical protein [Chlorobium sp.]